jgi:hypothetical protein
VQAGSGLLAWLLLPQPSPSSTAMAPTVTARAASAHRSLTTDPTRIGSLPPTPTPTLAMATPA